MPGLWIPGAIKRPIPYRGEAHLFTLQPLGWILHVVVGNGSPYNTFAKAKSPNRRFSHGWVSKTGVLEQYQTLDRQAWAQVAGNASYWAFETEGFPNEPLTTAQIATLSRVHKYLGTPDTLAEHPGQRGIGTHYMGGAAWGGHSCPDPIPGAGPRSKQRADIIRYSIPKPQPKPSPTDGEKMIGIVQVAGQAAEYYYNFFNCIHIQNPDHRSRILGEAKKRGVTVIVTTIGSSAPIKAGEYGAISAADAALLK